MLFFFDYKRQRHRFIARWERDLDYYWGRELETRPQHMLRIIPYIPYTVSSLLEV